MNTQEKAFRYPLPLVLGCIFLLCAILAVATTRANGGIALLWPGNAIVAAVLIRARRVNWLATAIAILVAGMSSNLIVGGDSGRRLSP